MDIIDKISQKQYWEEFLEYRQKSRQLSKAETAVWSDFIENEKYKAITDLISRGCFEPPLPVKMEINKSGRKKKRVVYSYPDEFSRILKIICYSLYEYDSFFSENCYAFRPAISARDAINRLSEIIGKTKLYCLKVDISDYFNSIDTDILLERLEFLKLRDERLYMLFKSILTMDKALDAKGNVLNIKRGAMAGIPVAPFLANVYLTQTDRFFEKRDVLYMRYSDDILLCAGTEDKLEKAKDELFDRLSQDRLSLNQDKLRFYRPGEAVEYLGLSIGQGKTDLSEMTKKKMKDKMRRKAHALRRWCIEKKLPPQRGAKGFITAMNRKLYVCSDDNSFSWSRWFFPNITTDEGLKELDAYMQQYVRWCISGRHYKGNYRISYEDMKKWGYKSLVHEYHSGRKTYGGH